MSVDTSRHGNAFGSVLVGLESRVVRVSAKVAPCDSSVAWITVTGLPDPAVRETRVRLGAAIGGFAGKAIAIHVEDVPTHADATGLDLPMAVAFLRAIAAPAASGAALNPNAVFVGELTLSGNVRPVRGALCRVGADPIVLPAGNAWEVGLAYGDASTVDSYRPDVFLIDRLDDLKAPLVRAERTILAPHVPHGRDELVDQLLPAFDQARAVPNGRVLFVGPPGSGKLMLARRLASESTSLAPSEQHEVMRIHGAAGLLGIASPRTARRPLRAPHHTVSEIGLVGGGERVRPGEVSLAHRGVLVLDELPEFRRATLQTLARVLRDKEATFARSRSIVRMPADPIAVVGTADLSSNASRHYEERLQELATLLGMTRIDVPMLTNAELARSQ